MIVENKPVMNVGDELLVRVWTVLLVVTDEYSDRVDRESSQEVTALEAPHRGGGGEVGELILRV